MSKTTAALCRNCRCYVAPVYADRRPQLPTDAFHLPLPCQLQAIPAANNVTPRQALQVALPGVTVTYSTTAATGYTTSNVAIDVQQCQVGGWGWMNA